MCDTMVHGAWFAKNSDREPSEPQYLEIRAGGRPGERRVACTYIEIPQVAQTQPVILSRPLGIWGAEMGVNMRGVAIGNEAVFTRDPVPKTGLTGMDLVRLALERAASATEALTVITDLLEAHGQGGSGGYRNTFYYHNAFLIADRDTAWVLETSARHWAAQRVHSGPRTISNVLSIRNDYELISANAQDHAREQGWWDGNGPFDFAGAYSSPVYRPLTGGVVRASCTADILSSEPAGGEVMRRALRSHGRTSPTGGWRSDGPCAHASWLPTRTAAQTTGSMIVDLSPSEPRVWATGTSSPCISVFKPVPFDLEFAFGERPGSTADGSLWWSHERLHRAALRNYERARSTFESERLAFEDEVWSEPGQPAHWRTHRRLALQWRNALAVDSKLSPSRLYWSYLNRKDGLLG